MRAVEIIPHAIVYWFSLKNVISYRQINRKKSIYFSTLASVSLPAPIRFVEETSDETPGDEKVEPVRGEFNFPVDTLSDENSTPWHVNTSRTF